jgi:hypothetical protein
VLSGEGSRPKEAVLGGIPGNERRPRLAVAAAVVQLGFAAAGALELDFDHANRIIAQYGALSGTDSSYGFFAPSVGTQLRATFVLTDAAGNTTTDILTTGVSAEADLRIGDMVAIFWMDDDDLKRGMAGSWAGRMLARHPEATRVVVHLDAYDLPSMDGYREGKRPEWDPYYEAEFVRRARASADPEPEKAGNP